MELDRYDRQILEILQSDGRISNQDLADRIGLSPSPCLRRVRTLEEAGLITGYRALLDAKKLKITRIQGVTGVHTSFVLRRVVDRTSLSLDGF
ncbi:MAG: winged helix-turn-helix transcriptional regulator [Dechloromonas sp.]|uniref:Winged helix-turn-helix transcriptional regulator n=1 Tax=Candidatus Dechloromonas phosphorivorans TaxID=2899244 RepID=A0A935JWK5_9RHOO|nr:winged helix-turn-helix transcriptional regulator [Candidatus Dechloromonas phosphorivorans]